MPRGQPSNAVLRTRERAPGLPLAHSIAEHDLRGAVVWRAGRWAAADDLERQAIAVHLNRDEVVRDLIRGQPGLPQVIDANALRSVGQNIGAQIGRAVTSRSTK